MLSVNNYPIQNCKCRSIDCSYAPSFKKNDGYNHSSSSRAKKLATGFASFAIPGLGQVINGETTKGIVLLLGSVCNSLIFFRKRTNVPLGVTGRLGIGSWAAYDAYKNA